MANPFEQFAAPVDPTAIADIPQPVMVKPGQSPDAAVEAVAPIAEEVAADPNNPFVKPEEQPVRLTGDAFSSALYDKFNTGAPAEEILEWAKSVGQDLEDSRNFRTNIAIRDQALAQGKKPSLGRVNERKLEEADPFGDVVGSAGAFARQGGNALLGNFGDELMAGAGALNDYLSGEGPGYRARHAELNALNDVDWAVDPAVSTSGVIAGSILGAKALPTFSSMQRVRQMNLAARAGVGAGEGAAVGAVAATGEGTPDDRFANTAGGAALGAGIGAAAEPLINVAGRIIRPVTERLRPDGARALANRADLSQQEIDAMRAEVQRQQDLGIQDSSLLDVMPERGRNVVGSAGVHEPAREALQEVADARTVQLPERVGAAADEIVAPAGIQGSADEVRTGIDAQRDAEIAAALDPIRATPLPMSPDIAEVLGTRAGQRAIQAVIDETADPVLRGQLAELQTQTRQLARSIDPRLPESAQQAAQGVIIDNMPFTIDLSERIGRKMGQIGRETGNPAMFAFSDTVKAGANVSPRFREIMERYGTMSNAADAVGVGSGVRTVMDDTGRVTREADEGAGFMAEPAGRFEQRAGALSRQPMRAADGSELRTGPYPEGTVYRGGAPFDPNYKGVTFTTPDEVAARGYVDMHEERFGTPGRVDALAMAGKNAAPYEAVEAAAERAGIELDNGTPASWFDTELQDEEAVRRMMDDLRRQGYDHTNLPDLPWAGMATRREDGSDWIDAVIPFDNAQLTAARRPNPAPSERDLARLGAAEQVRTRAGKGPSEAKGTASQLYDSPEQRRRSVALLGEEGADRLANRMREEVQRVYRATRQATKEGPASERGMAGAESTVNVLYNPTSPVSWIREAGRFLHRIGLSERDALWIVRNATDPAQTTAIIDRLEKAGMDTLKARANAAQLREAAVRFFTQDDSQ